MKKKNHAVIKKSIKWIVLCKETGHAERSCQQGFNESTIIFREHVPRTIGLFGQRGGRFYFLFSLHFFPWLISSLQELCTLALAHSLGFAHACCSCNALRPLSINLAVVIFSDRDSRPLLIFRTRLSRPGDEFIRPVLSCSFSLH